MIDMDFTGGNLERSSRPLTETLLSKEEYYDASIYTPWKRERETGKTGFANFYAAAADVEAAG